MDIINMSSNDIAIKIENLSKCYRIGLKEELHDSFASAIFDFIKSPLKNYRKYRSLYKFEDIRPDFNQNSNPNPPDMIWALRGISFQVRQGETLGIIGKNGAGKSTLLKILSRITDPTTGHAEIRGRVSTLLEVGTGFHPELTGRENIFLNGTILGMTKKEVDRKFDEIVDFSGVEKFIDTPVKRYSSGMKLRLAFSVAAHLEPEILMIDEVLAVGDAAFQSKCIKKMQEVAKHGRTVLFVSHNMGAIRKLCSRAILLDSGSLQLDADISQVIKQHMWSSFNKSSSKISLACSETNTPQYPLEFNWIQILVDGLATNLAPMGSSLQILTHCSIKDFSPFLKIGIRIMNEEGDLLSTLSPNQQCPELLETMGSKSVLVCTIPHLNLIPGTYHIVPEFSIGGDMKNQSQPLTCSFQVTERDVYGTGIVPSKVHGIMFFDATWSIATEKILSIPK